MPGGKRLYSIEGVLSLLGKNDESGKKSYIYARVSSDHQKGDLERQIQDLKKAYPRHELIQDIGSGVNFKRKGLETLLERVLSGMVSEVVVMHRDRLARIGFELLEFIFEKTGTKLLVHCPTSNVGQGELAEDLLAVTTHFVASYNGRRAAENRKRRKEAKDNQTSEDSD